MQALARVLRWLNLTRFCTKKISLKHHHRQKGLRLLLPLNSWWLYITKLEISWGKSGNRRENWVLVGIKKNGWKSLGIPRGSFGPEDDLGGVHCPGDAMQWKNSWQIWRKGAAVFFPCWLAAPTACGDQVTRRSSSSVEPRHAGGRNLPIGRARRRQSATTSLLCSSFNIVKRALNSNLPTQRLNSYAMVSTSSKIRTAQWNIRIIHGLWHCIFWFLVWNIIYERYRYINVQYKGYD